MTFMMIDRETGRSHIELTNKLEVNTCGVLRGERRFDLSGDSTVHNIYLTKWGTSIRISRNKHSFPR